MTTERPRVEEIWGSGAVGGRQRVLSFPSGERSQIALDSAEWFAWLEEARTTSFSYAVFDPACGYIIGMMTVNKEQRQRGGRYWRVARRVGGRVRKIYLGRSEEVTEARLAAIAAGFCTGGERVAFPQEGQSRLTVTSGFDERNDD
jgi:hypothetical protein